MVCKLCMGKGNVDWVTAAIHPPLSNREKPMSYLEQKQKVENFRKRMKERIKNDESRTKR